MAAKASNNKLNIPVNFRLVSVVLFVVLIVMLAVWQPWSAAARNNQTIKVSGSATVTAKPDQYTFNPSYEFKNSDNKAALAEMTKKKDKVVAGLKKIGVSESKIKADSDSWRYRGSTNVSMYLTVDVEDKDLAQKVQDYLVGTSPQGKITPYSTFTEAKQKELEAKARKEASADAKSKADDMAENLGFRVGGVKSVSVSNNSDIGDTLLFSGKGVAESDASPGLDINEGENDLKYSVSVVYYIR